MKTMKMISQIDELKQLIAPKLSELGLDEGTVEKILSKAMDFSEKELKPHSMKWDENGTHFEKIYKIRLRSKNENVELGENEYSILDKYGHIDEAVLTGRRLLFPEYFEEVQKKGLAKQDCWGYIYRKSMAVWGYLTHFTVA